MVGLVIKAYWFFDLVLDSQLLCSTPRMLSCYPTLI